MVGAIDFAWIPHRLQQLELSAERRKCIGDASWRKVESDEPSLGVPDGFESGSTEAPPGVPLAPGLRGINERDHAFRGGGDQ